MGFFLKKRWLDGELWEYRHSFWCPLTSSTTKMQPGSLARLFNLCANLITFCPKTPSVITGWCWQPQGASLCLVRQILQTRCDVTNLFFWSYVAHTAVNKCDYNLTWLGTKFTRNYVMNLSSNCWFRLKATLKWCILFQFIVMVYDPANTMHICWTVFWCVGTWISVWDW